MEGHSTMVLIVNTSPTELCICLWSFGLRSKFCFHIKFISLVPISCKCTWKQNGTGNDVHSVTLKPEHVRGT